MSAQRTTRFYMCALLPTPSHVCLSLNRLGERWTSYISTAKNALEPVTSLPLQPVNSKSSGAVVKLVDMLAKHNADLEKAISNDRECAFCDAVHRVVQGCMPLCNVIVASSMMNLSLCVTGVRRSHFQDAYLVSCVHHHAAAACVHSVPAVSVLKSNQ